MLKKAFVSLALMFSLGAYLFGSDLTSILGTASENVRDAVKSEVSVEFEMDRARNLIQELLPEIRKCMHLIAEQKVDMDHLDGEIARKTAALDEQREIILTMRDDLQTGNKFYVYAGDSYTAEEVSADLEKRFDQFKKTEETVIRDRKILAARTKTLQANREKLTQMIAAKKDLEVQVAELEARLRTVEAVEAANSMEFDDSKLAKTKKLLATLNREVDIREQLINENGQTTGLIPVNTKPESKADVGTEIDNYFGKKTAGKNRKSPGEALKVTIIE